MIEIKNYAIGFYWSEPDIKYFGITYLNTLVSIGKIINIGWFHIYVKKYIEL